MTMAVQAEEGPHSKDCGRTSETGKGEETGSPPASPGGTQPSRHLDVRPVRLIADF